MSKYRIDFIPAFEAGGWSYTEEFNDLSVAKIVLNSIANYTLMLHEKELMHDYSNVVWIEIFEDGDWMEIEEEEDERI